MMHVSGEAVRVGACVATFQMDLVRPHAVELDEPGGIERHAAVRISIDLRQPALDPVGIELIVPSAIERVREIDPLAVAADLHHLRRAVQRLARAGGMRCTTNDAADPYRAGLDRVE